MRANSAASGALPVLTNSSKALIRLPKLQATREGDIVLSLGIRLTRELAEPDAIARRQQQEHERVQVVRMLKAVASEVEAPYSECPITDRLPLCFRFCGRKCPNDLESGIQVIWLQREVELVVKVSRYLERELLQI